MEKIYDVIIIGGGPAGYTAAIYTARAGFKTLILEKRFPGGQMTQTEQIDNYPGFENGIDGISLGSKMQMQAHRFGAKTLNEEVISADLISIPKRLTTASGEYPARAVIIAAGAEPRHLGLAEEKKLIGKGVSYCAVCDGFFFKNKDVLVIGGGNTAASEALFLSKICKSVTLVHRRDTLRAERAYSLPLEAAKNISFRYNSTLTEILSEEAVCGAVIRNTQTGETDNIRTDGIFVCIGRKPATRLFENQLALDEYGYIIADESAKTNLSGVFAAGDIRTKSVRQIVTAVSDGACAAYSAEKYLSGSEA